jgi:hypothetical protein
MTEIPKEMIPPGYREAGPDDVLVNGVPLKEYLRELQCQLAAHKAALEIAREELKQSRGSDEH